MQSWCWLRCSCSPLSPNAKAPKNTATTLKDNAVASVTRIGPGTGGRLCIGLGASCTTGSDTGATLITTGPAVVRR